MNRKLATSMLLFLVVLVNALALFVHFNETMPADQKLMWVAIALGTQVVVVFLFLFWPFVYGYNPFGAVLNTPRRIHAAGFVAFVVMLFLAVALAMVLGAFGTSLFMVSMVGTALVLFFVISAVALVVNLVR